MRNKELNQSFAMLFTFSIVGFVLIVGSGLALAQSEVSPFGPRPDIIETPDDVMAAVADEIPGFAGLFLDDGDLVVRMRGTAKAEDLDRVLDHPRLQSKLQLNAADFRRSGGPGVRALPATYDFRELHTWRQLIKSKLFGTPGVTLVDVNEQQNQVTLGISPERSTDSDGLRARVQAQLDDMGIPVDAVEIVEVKIALHNHNVQHSFNLKTAVAPCEA